MDERLVAPGSRYEIDDGKLVYVAPADPPHAISHGALGALLRAHRHPALTVALDMLTRTSTTSDIAPDASIFPSAIDPATGGRQLEVLAFEIMSTETISHAGRKAAMLAGRGVRRVFGIDVVRKRVFEWSPQLADWSMLATDGRIEDESLAVPLPIAALVDAAHADDATVKAYRAQRHAEFLAEREEGREQGLRDALRRMVVSKFGPLDPTTEARIAAASGDQVDAYLQRILSSSSIAGVFGDP